MPSPNESIAEQLRSLPKVDRLLVDPELVPLLERGGRTLVTQCLREALDATRERVRSGSANGDLRSAVLAETAQRLQSRLEVTLDRAINATGIVLHTGLGRAVLCASAAEAAARAAADHCLLEVDSESGERGSRQAHIAGLLRELTGAEDALAVNNNAAAVFLAVSALAAGREVLIARGQLVEIGGAFRVPDVIRSAGARLVEVGTTNKARLSDYQAGLSEHTALILRVHPSNFRIVGFTEEVPLEALVELGRRASVPVLDDLGSGALTDVSAWGVGTEPTVHASVAAGADVVTFSGDKLLGGPQAGIAIGTRDSLDRLRRHPLMRVVRPDKLTLAALAATLQEYRRPESAPQRIPTLRALSATPAELQTRAAALAGLLEGIPAEVTLVEGVSQVGGGALPGEALPTTLVSIVPAALEAGEFMRRLRTGRPSVWGRVRQGAALFDVRTLLPDQELLVAERVRAVLDGKEVNQE